MISQIIHQFLTDVRRLWVPLALYACLLVAYGVATVDQLEQGHVTICWGLGEFPWEHRLPQWLLPLGVVWLCALLFLGDPAHGVTSFWRTRPWDRRAMGLTKATFMFLLVALPAGLASLVEPLRFRVPDRLALLAHLVGNMGETLTLIWIVWLAIGFAANRATAFGLSLLAVLLMVLIKKTALLLPLDRRSRHQIVLR